MLRCSGRLGRISFINWGGACGCSCFNIIPAERGNLFYGRLVPGVLRTLLQVAIKISAKRAAGLGPSYAELFHFIIIITTI